MKRPGLLDYLRGVALLGIIFINMTQMVQAVQPEVGSFDRCVRIALDYVVYQHFFVLFSFLFGVGFYLFVSRAKERGDRSTPLFVRRLCGHPI